MLSIDDLIDDRPADDVFTVNRRIFTDEELFDLEMKYIFERTWNFLGFEARVAKPHDFFTTWIGRVPVLVTRTADGLVKAFLNKCTHRGARLCPEEQGSSRVFVCPYHAWSFDSSGKLVAIKENGAGGYPECFKALDHGLEQLARVEVYRGFVFGSLSAHVPSLEDYLGSMKFFIDIAMDQGAQGMEPIPGRSVYTYRGNWKLQLENGLDSYHLTSTHRSFLEIMQRRRRGEGNVAANTLDFERAMNETQTGLGFANGHSAVVVEYGEQGRRPFIDLEEVRKRVPPERARFVDLTYNTLIFPNMQLLHNTALAIRVFRPLSPDLTEMHYFCLGAIGETVENRAMRLRAFEDFYNASGIATPDDSAVYELCQQGFLAGGRPWLQGYSRGIALRTRATAEQAGKFGVDAAEVTIGSQKTGTEVPFHAPYREWARLMAVGFAEAAS
jgi:phenylpropionate dioxygenase-like ring-hydroxylating dioxygenase large terminal subunit